MVLSREEIGAILKELAGTEQLIVMLLYGSGLRIEECLELRVKDSISIATRSSCDKGKAKKIG